MTERELPGRPELFLLFNSELSKQWKNRAIRTLISSEKIIKHLYNNPKDLKSLEKLRKRNERLSFYLALAEVNKKSEL